MGVVTPGEKKISASSWSLIYSQFMMHGQKNIKLAEVRFLAGAAKLPFATTSKPAWWLTHCLSS